MPCCKCNGSGARCKGCSCAKSNKGCVDCYPGRRGKCSNASNRSPAEQASSQPSTPSKKSVQDLCTIVSSNLHRTIIKLRWLQRSSTVHRQSDHIRSLNILDYNEYTFMHGSICLICTSFLIDQEHARI